MPRPAPLRVAKEVPAARPTAPAVLPTTALDDRIAIVGTAGSGKTYTAKGFVERLLMPGPGSRLSILSASGGDCAPARPAIPGIRSLCLADAMRMCRSRPKWERRSDS
ncbi:MAG: hypothetical protein AB7O13_25945 [Alphaproteobacteria bacterium]